MYSETTMNVWIEFWLMGRILRVFCNVKCIHGSIHNTKYIIAIESWLSARLQYLQCLSTGDTAVLQ